MDAATLALVRAEASRATIPLSDQAEMLLVRFVELLSQWARRIRLTGSHEPRSIVQRHIADALAATRLLEDAHGRAVDVGSGAGLPGIPLAMLCPQLAFTLVEPNQRRASFLRTAAYELSLGVEVLPVRLEQLEGELFRVACSRATWPPAEWLARARPLLDERGRVLVFTARREMLPSEHAGLQLHRALAYTLADGTPRALGSYEAARAVRAAEAF